MVISDEDVEAEVDAGRVRPRLGNRTSESWTADSTVESELEDAAKGRDVSAID